MDIKERTIKEGIAAAQKGNWKLCEKRIKGLFGPSSGDMIIEYILKNLIEEVKEKKVTKKTKK
jgi:hypothetical protein